MEFKKLSYQCYFLHLSRAAIRIETELVYFCRSIFYAVFHRNTRIIYYASYILFSLINYCTSLIKNKLYLYFIKKKKKNSANECSKSTSERSSRKIFRKDVNTSRFEFSFFSSVYSLNTHSSAEQSL